MSLIVKTFASFDINPAAQNIFCSSLYNRRAKKLQEQYWEKHSRISNFVLVASIVQEHNASH